LRAVGRRHTATHHHAHSTRGLRADLRLLGGKLSLLLGICSLRRPLSLLVLLAVSLVNGLRDGLSTDPLSHLSSLALSGVDRTDETALGLRRAFAAGKGNQRATRDPCDMLLLAGRQI